MTIKEKSLADALDKASLLRTGLPKQYKEGSGEIWIKAIVLVEKSNLEECYCLYSRKGDGFMQLEKDCGSGTGIVKKRLSIHPYIYLDKERFFPNVGYKQKRDFLKTELSDRPDEAALVDLMGDEQVDIALIDEGIRRQLLNFEADRISNAQAEGNDLEGSNRLNEMEREFQATLAEMKANGVSKVDMKAYIDDFEKRKKEMLTPAFKSDEDYTPEEELLRQEMEAKDLERIEAEKKASVEGEFDAPELDLAAVREASEQYRREQILIAKRKFKRKMDGQDKFANGANAINELGEIEDVETLALPDDASDKQVAAFEKAQARKDGRIKVGRPKGSKSKKTTARKTATRKTDRKA